MTRLFRVSIPTSVLILIITEFAWMYGALLLVGRIFFDEDFGMFLSYDDGWRRLAIFVASVMITFYFDNLYDNFAGRSIVSLLSSGVFGLGVAFVIQSMIAYMGSGWIVPRSILLPAGAMLALVFPVWRIAFVRFFMGMIGRSSVLFLGADSLAQDIVTSIGQRPELAIQPLGFVADEYAPGSYVAGVKVLGPVSELSNIVSELCPDRIVVGMEERRARLPIEDLLRIRLSGVHIEEAATTFQTAFSRIPTRAIRHSQLIFSTELDPLPRNLRLQMIYSMLLAAIGLTVAAPVMLLVAIAIRLTSRGPVFFRQTRVGMGGKPFTIYKFRSMVVDAESKTGAVWATRNDPRITPVGSFLRKTRLDEIPQLLNVIQRDMAIVGPRPERPEFVATLSELIPFYAHRHSVKPGITGWAQINYKYGESVEDAIRKLEYDMYYIKNLSPALDFYVMLHTLKAMLTGDLAH